jgi:YHS domain-containing protein
VGKEIRILGMTEGGLRNMDCRKKILVVVILIIGMAFVLGHAVYAKEPNQTKCPVLGSPVNKKVYTDYRGKRIYFCCPPCIRKFKNDPDQYMKPMEKEGVVLEDAPQAKNQ